MVEHVLGKDGVSGSIPLIGSRILEVGEDILGLSGSKAATGHLRLAEGLIKTAEIGGAPSEYEIRNAFSRSYYALFHACRAYLWAQNVTSGQGDRISHGSLRAEMGRQMGRSFGEFLQRSYERRRDSDYEPTWSIPPFYRCVDDLKQARGHFYFVTRTVRNLISQAQG